MLHIAAQSSLVKWERGRPLVMGTTATVDRLDTMCFLISVEPRVSETTETNNLNQPCYTRQKITVKEKVLMNISVYMPVHNMVCTLMITHIPGTILVEGEVLGKETRL